MSDYRVTVTVPVELADVASAVGRAMDIDVGGADSFVERDGVLVAQTWASEAFATMFQYFTNHPFALWQAVCSDYETRWVGMQPPSEEEVLLFCTTMQLDVVPTIDKH